MYLHVCRYSSSKKPVAHNVIICSPTAFVNIDRNLRYYEQLENNKAGVNQMRVVRYEQIREGQMVGE